MVRQEAAQKKSSAVSIYSAARGCRAHVRQSRTACSAGRVRSNAGAVYRAAPPHARRRTPRKPLCSSSAGTHRRPLDSAGPGRGCSAPGGGAPPGSRPRRAGRPRPPSARGATSLRVAPAPCVAGGAGSGDRGSLDLLGVGHLQPREGVPQRRQVLRDAALEDLAAGPRGVDRVADLLEVVAAPPAAPPPPPAPACGRRGSGARSSPGRSCRSS